MSKQKNRRIFLILTVTVLILVLPWQVTAGNDTTRFDLYKTHFKFNVLQLNEYCCFPDSGVFRGTFSSQNFNSPKDEYNNLELSVFSNYTNETADYYNFLIGLSSGDKQNIIRLFSYYEPVFDEVLQKAGLPRELKYLAPALSAMNNRATGEGKRAGVWQLTHFQAVLNGAGINKFVDERFDIYQSTVVAAKQIKTNLSWCNNLDMAVAAFLYGPVNVRNAMQEAKKRGVQVENLLPREFNSRIAAFQAMALFLNSNKFIATPVLISETKHNDTVTIYRRLHFKMISEVLNIPESKLQCLNPEYKYSIIPGDEKPGRLILPPGEKDDFVFFADSVYSCYDSALFSIVTQKIEYPPAPTRQYLHEPVKDLTIEGKTKIKYRIKTGDVLGIIAEDFDVRVADLKYWNNIYNERKIRAGRTLDIFVDTDKVEHYKQIAGVQTGGGKQNSAKINSVKKTGSQILAIPKSAKKVEHIVKSGESPYDIAKQYNGVTPEEILEVNHIDDARKIQIGQKLIIYVR